MVKMKIQDMPSMVTFRKTDRSDSPRFDTPSIARSTDCPSADTAT